jgi:hypothetical protein
MKMIPCPTCGEELEDTGALAGKLVRCPGCSTEFRMPTDPARPRTPEPVHEPYGSAPIWGDPASRVPTKLQVVQILMIVGGAISLFVAFGLIVTLIGLLWPGTYYAIFLGVLAIIRGVRMLDPDRGPPTGTAVMQILNIFNLDLFNVAFGIAELVLLNDPEVRSYFERRRRV